MKEKFKEFIKNKPYLADYIKTREMTWQDFYELYDLYGDKKEIWDKYPPKKEKTKITDYFQNINLDNIEEHLTEAEKVLSIISELTNKEPPKQEEIKELKKIDNILGE